MPVDSLATARQIIRVGPVMMKALGAELRRCATLQDFSQVGLMRVLAHKGMVTMSVLADLWSVSLPTMSRSVRRLEERGWVKLSRTEEDRRQVLVELTPSGREVLEDSNDHMARGVEALVKGLSPEDHQKLDDSLNVLWQMFEPTLHRPPESLEDAQGMIQDVHKA